MSASSNATDFHGTDRFSIKRRLGEGGMGIVYEAYDNERDATVALKTMRHLGPDALYRLKNEFRSLHDITHPNLARLGELRCEGGVWFFTMEYIDGVDILSYIRGGDAKHVSALDGDSTARDHLMSSGAVRWRADEDTITDPCGPAASGDWQRPSADASRAPSFEFLGRTAAASSESAALPGFDELRLRHGMQQLVLAINALHAAGKVHRDIKPSNTLVDAQGRLALLDFGLIAEPARSRADDRRPAGTPAYMAPEQALGHELGPEADWYSVGVLLYEALTGRRPHDCELADELLFYRQAIPATLPKRWRKTLPEDLCSLCLDLLLIDPALRPRGREIARRVAALNARRASAPGAADGTVSESERGVSKPPLGAASNSSRSRRARSAPIANHVSGWPVAPFVGRVSQLADLWRAFEDSRQTQGIGVFVRGESGVGKSLLIRHFADGILTQHPRTVVLAGRCYERESVPYKAFDGIVDVLSEYLASLPIEDARALLPDNASLLPMLFPVLGRVQVIAEAPRPAQTVHDPHEQRSRMFEAVREVFGRIAALSSLILIIDDLQWADAESFHLFAHVMRSPAPPGMLVVASVRDAGETAGAAISELSFGAREVLVQRLERREARQLATLLLEQLNATSLADAAAIAHETDGHPLFIDELVRYTTTVRRPFVGEVRLDDAIRARVALLEPPAQKLLEFVALVGAPLPYDMLARAAEIDQEQAERAVSALRVARLVRMSSGRDADSIEAYHDRVRESVLFSLDTEKRRDFHSRIATMLDTLGVADAQPEMLVRHLEAAGRVQQATMRAERAAQRAEQALAFDRATGLYRTALRLGDFAPERRHRLTAALAAAAGSAGRGAESAAAYLALCEGADPARRLEYRRMAGEQFLVSGHVEQGLTTMGGVLVEVGVKLPASPRAAFSSLIWHSLKLRLHGIRWRPRHSVDVPARTLAKIDVFSSVSHGLALVDTIRGLDFEVRGLLLALRTGEESRILRAVVQNAAYLATRGGRALRRAREVAEIASKLAAAADDSLGRVRVDLSRGVIAYYEGRFEAAAALLSQCELSLLEQPSVSRQEVNSARLFRLLAIRRLGSYEELRRCHDDYVREARQRGDRYLESSLRRLFNDLHLAADDPEMADEALGEAAWLPPEGRFHLQHWYELRARTETDLYRGAGHGVLERRATLFAGLRRSFLLKVQDARMDYYWIQGRAAIAEAGEAHHRRQALRRVARAARLLAREKVPYGTVQAFMLRAAGARVLSRDGLAVQLLAAAERAAEESGLRMHLATARYRRGELLGGDGGASLIAEASFQIRGAGFLAPERAVAWFNGA